MQMPEKSAVKLMATPMRPVEIRRSRCMAGTTLTSDPANNQKVTTASTIPSSSLLEPWYVAFAATCDVCIECCLPVRTALPLSGQPRGTVRALGEIEHIANARVTTPHVMMYAPLNRFPRPERSAVSGRQPGLRGNDQRFHASLQGRMDDRREMRVVIRRDLVELASRFRLRVQVGVGTANKPEHRWDVPFGSIQAEVLARRRRLRLHHALVSELLAKGVHDTLGRLGIVGDERIAVQRRERGRLRRTRCLRFGVDDALDRGEHALAHARVEGTDVQLDDRLIGDDVLLGSSL